jgi:hypothetical protein
MSDCTNVEMRERLPELASGALDAASRAHVEAHVAGCAECASELETLRLVRAAFSTTPAVDTRRIVAALPKPPVVTPAAGARRGPIRRWMDWRIAAALTMVTVGGLSVAVIERMGTGRATRETPPAAQTLPAATVESTAVGNTTNPPQRDSLERTMSRSPTLTSAPGVRVERAQLSIGGGTDDLDRASIEALMTVLDELDRAPIVPSAEPDRVTLVPIISDGTQ